jgi:ubiquinol-cytochrome c reductase cytochrome b subunit
MSFWGELYCPTCLSIQFYSLPFILSHTRNHKRIGPHDFFILSLIFGSLLGDGYAEKHGNGTRIQFSQEGSHSQYLLWLYSIIANRGYTSNITPKLQTRLGKYGKLRHIIRFKTYTFTSFNWIHDCWYKFYDNKYIKILPSSTDLDMFLSPLALAIWIMDDGGRVSSGLKLATNHFLLSEVQILSSFLNNKYDLATTIQSTSTPNKFIIYVPKKKIEKLNEIVKPYIHPSMKYKLIN